MMTTYPLAAKSSGFQRYDQSSPQAPSGPPWIRNFTGYFLLASKFGGLTRKPWTLLPCAPVNQKDSRGGMSIYSRTARFRLVSALASSTRGNRCSRPAPRVPYLVFEAGGASHLSGKNRHWP